MSEFIGLSNYRASNRIDQRYLFNGKNVLFDRGKILASAGHDPFLPALVGGTDIQSMVQYGYDNAGTPEAHLVYQYNKEWYNINLETNVRTALTAGLAFDEEADGEQFVNSIYAVSPNNGGMKIVGNVYSAVAGIPAGSMMEFAWEKMWIAGVAGALSTVFGSATATAADITKVEDFAGIGAQTELVGKGGRITALKFFKNSLYIFKNNGEIHFIQPDLNSATPLYIPKPFSLTGSAVNDRCVAVVENDVWFLTPDLQIRALGAEPQYINDTRTRDLSDIIRGIMDTLDSDQTNKAVMNYFNRICTIALATKGSSTANIVIKFNYDNGGFSIDRYPAVKQWESSGNRIFMATKGSGQLYQDRTSYTFGGEFEIPWEATFPFYDNLRPDNNYRARKIYIRGRRSRGVAIEVKLYSGNYNNFSSRTIPEPTDAETMNPDSEEGVFGAVQFGSQPFGGSGTNNLPDIPEVFIFEKTISVSSMSNMFAIGLSTSLLGQRIEIEQVILYMQPGSKQFINI